jgi:hypothetical protein
VSETTAPAGAREVNDWLLDTDPAIRWQVQRDLFGAGPADVAAERGRVAREGWGARLLELQADDGQWGGGVYSPKWISTTYTLLLLRHLGIDPDDEKMHSAIERQRDDGGWNCRVSSDRSSFHTTISVLEALLEHERATGGDRELAAARVRAHEYLLERRLMYRLSTGEVINTRWLLMSFPPRWHYDVLRALDYLREAGVTPDPRWEDAIDVIRSKRRKGGTWPLQNRHPGKEHFQMEPAGEPSRWNTLRALRVLQWQDRARA